MAGIKKEIDFGSARGGAVAAAAAASSGRSTRSRSKKSSKKKEKKSNRGRPKSPPLPAAAVPPPRTKALYDERLARAVPVTTAAQLTRVAERAADMMALSFMVGANNGSLPTLAQIDKTGRFGRSARTVVDDYMRFQEEGCATGSLFYRHSDDKGRKDVTLQNTKMNAEYYERTLINACRAWRKCEPDAKVFHLFVDNAPPHTEKAAKAALEEEFEGATFNFLHLSTYSPDRASLDLAINHSIKTKARRVMTFQYVKKEKMFKERGVAMERDAAVAEVDDDAEEEELEEEEDEQLYVLPTPVCARCGDCAVGDAEENDAELDASEEPSLDEEDDAVMDEDEAEAEEEDVMDQKLECCTCDRAWHARCVNLANGDVDEDDAMKVWLGVWSFACSETCKKIHEAATQQCLKEEGGETDEKVWLLDLARTDTPQSLFNVSLFNVVKMIWLEAELEPMKRTWETWPHVFQAVIDAGGSSDYALPHWRSEAQRVAVRMAKSAQSAIRSKHAAAAAKSEQKFVKVAKQ